MFKYKFVQDEATGKRYWIDKAILTNDNGPDSKGGNWYEIDLQPEDPDEKAICGLDLIEYGDEVHIAELKNAGKKERAFNNSGHVQVFGVLAVVHGDTLVVPKSRGHAPVVDLESWVPEEADRMGIIREMWINYSIIVHGIMKANHISSPEEESVHELLDGTMEAPLTEYRDAIQDEFIRILNIWNKDVMDAAAGDSDRAAIYRRVLGLSSRC